MNLIVTGRNFVQVTVPTGTPGIRTALMVLRREGFRASSSQMGRQVTPAGLVKMTLLSVHSPDDSEKAGQIIRTHIPAVR